MLDHSPPLIAVLGATGAQGGAVARALLSSECGFATSLEPPRGAGRAGPALAALKSGGFAVRALTRHPHGAQARALRDAGAEVVHADLDQPATLRRSFAGAQGLFAVTSYWAHHSPEAELQQAAHIAEAALAARVPHVVWSTQEDTRRWVPLEDEQMPTLRSGWKVPHFDAKGAADELFRRRGVPLTRLVPPLFWEHLAPFGVLPQRDAAGRLVLPLPMGERPLPGMSVADIGPIVRAVLTDPQRWLGRRLGVAAAHLDGAQMAAALARALGEPVLHRSPRFADVAARPLPGAAGIANMFQFLHDFNEEVLAMRPLAAARALHPGPLGFDAWLTLNVHGLPMEQRAAAYEAGLLVY